jgi:hypothetical protein
MIYYASEREVDGRSAVKSGEERPGTLVVSLKRNTKKWVAGNACRE